MSAPERRTWTVAGELCKLMSHAVTEALGYETAPRCARSLYDIETRAQTLTLMLANPEWHPPAVPYSDVRTHCVDWL
jgi:hypothetical protein